MGSLIVSLPLVALHLETVDRSAAADLERVKGGRPSSCAVTRIRGRSSEVSQYLQPTSVLYEFSLEDSKTVLLVSLSLISVKCALFLRIRLTTELVLLGCGTTSSCL